MPDKTRNNKPLIPAKYKWLLVLLVLLVAVWGCLQGTDLRRTSARARLEANWQPDNRAIPALQAAWQQCVDLGRPLSQKQSQQLWQELESFKGAHAEFFWLGLSLLEARSGRPEQARQALARARALEKKIDGFTRSPIWDPWRKELGLPTS